MGRTSGVSSLLPLTLVVTIVVIAGFHGWDFWFAIQLVFSAIWTGIQYIAHLIWDFAVWIGNQGWFQTLLGK